MSEWREHIFTDVFKIQGGSQPAKKEFIYEPKDGYIRLLQIRDFGNKPFPTYVPVTSKLKICNPDDVLIGRYGGQGKILTGMYGAYNVAIAKVIIPDTVNSRFAYHLLKSDVFYGFITNIERSAIDGFNKDDLSKLTIRIPPTIEEQKQIVERLEARLEKLNNARQKLKKIPLVLKRFRQSVLASACDGRLTANWREGRGLAKWEEKQFCECAKIDSNLVSPKDFLSLPHIAPDNIEKGTGKLLHYKTVEEDKLISAKHLFKKGHILYSKIRPYLNKVVIVDFEGLCSADMYPVSTNQNTYYLKYYMLSNSFVSDASNKDRTILPKINQKELSKIIIPLPPLPEQEEIVRIVDKLFAIADSIEKRYNNIKAKLDKAEKSLYAKAFRGEL